MSLTSMSKGIFFFQKGIEIYCSLNFLKTLCKLQRNLVAKINTHQHDLGKYVNKIIV